MIPSGWKRSLGGFSVRARVAIFAAAVVFALAAQQGGVLAGETEEAFMAKLDLAVQTEDFVGLAVGIVRGGEVAVLKTYGTREAGEDEPVTPDTVFRLASLSKGFAASLAALEVEEGRLSWDAPVSKMVPGFRLITPDATAQVTVETILSQRIGLPPYAYDRKLEAGVPPDDILKSYSSLDLVCPVNACYTYQNTAFNLIAKMLEDIEGRPFETLVRDRIFNPLDMRTASYGRANLENSDDWARPHIRYGRNPWRVTHVDDSYYSIPAAGGVNASIRDMTQWLKAQMGEAPEVLPPDVLEVLHSPHIESKAETRRWRIYHGRMVDSFYGLGWRIYDYAGHQVISHTGGVRGYLAQIAFLPEQDVGIVILANAHGKRTNRILPTFLDMELGLRDMDWLMLEDPS